MNEQGPKPDTIAPIQRDVLKIGVGEGSITFREISDRLKDGRNASNPSSKLSAEDLSRVLRALEDSGLLEKRWSWSLKAKTLLGGESRDQIVEVPPAPAAPVRERRVVAGPITRRRIEPQPRQESRVEKPVAPAQPVVLETKLTEEPSPKTTDKSELKKIAYSVGELVDKMKAKKLNTAPLFKEGETTITFTSDQRIKIESQGTVKFLTIEQALVDPNLGYKKLDRKINEILHRWR